MGMWPFAENENPWASDKIIWRIDGKGDMAFLDISTEITAPEFPIRKVMPICYKKISNQRFVILLVFKLLRELWKNRTHGSAVFGQMTWLSMCMVREGHIPEVLLPLRIER